MFSTAQEFMEKIGIFKPMLIFLNNKLPDLENCQELCIALRAHPNTETVPLIVLTSDSPNQQEKIKLFQAGLIEGYFSMPLNIEELAAYTNVFLQRQALQEELEEKNLELGKMSITDDLTQIYNRRFLINRLQDEINKINRYTYPLSALMTDIDHFKKINDEHGHSQGDNILKELAAVLKKNLRSIDMVCRYGGEEFIILLPHTNYAGAKITAERILKKIEQYNFNLSEKNEKLTISIGFATFHKNESLDIDTIITNLDKQLYKAKNSGRNKACGIAFKE